MSRTQISDSVESLHTESEPVVTVQHLVKRYGQFVAVNDVSFSIKEGEILGISHVKNSTYKKLSGGQKQRLSIALALVGNPKIAILDELTTGLDPEARRETWTLIESMRDRGATVILVTHFMDEAERLCDRLALINHGKLIVLDT